MHKCLSGISLVVQWSSSKETVWKSSSSSSSSRSSHIVRVHLECGCCGKSMGFCSSTVLEGDGMSTVEISSPSELLKDNWNHTGLWHDWLVPMLHGVVGSKEMLSSLDTWWILGIHQMGVGMLKFSLPLS